ncbi:PREDICTED: pentatricopeptide repeat-containing protein At3g12770-like [Nelumbo nucifera]|uniref:Pentatricopeptide repeat-containing protein At3g12770-like n=1 Tax=Nelumbo nucifera TaxID=4432 RepID=A0A1U8AQQ8_NELNU|nr:PREDICTED: pentatricopeptide repeat-containing protein At3g12770-like [Nelumbo nucifera]
MHPSSLPCRFFFFFVFSAKIKNARAFSRFCESVTVLDPSHQLLHLLQLAVDHNSLKLTQQTHGRIYSRGFDQNAFVATKLISSYSTCGVPADSRLVFESVREKNVFLWNSLISGYVKNGIFEEAFHIFNRMRRDDEMPDNYTVATLSKISGELGHSEIGRMIHNLSIKSGFVSDTVAANSLMSMYGRCGRLGDVRNLFDEMPCRNSASWNVLISGNAVSGNSMFDEDVWKLVKQMQMEGVKPDAFTFSSLLPFCGNNNGQPDHGREIHGFIIKDELILESDVHVGSCLIDMYSRCQKVSIARRVFDQMSCKNIVSWTAMISGYVQNEEAEEALTLFREMQMRYGVEPNRVSLVSVLPACSSLAGLMEGKQIHGFAIRKVLHQKVSLSNALIDMYCKCGNLNWARHVFDDDSCCKDAISWSSIIAGYGLHGKGHEAIFLFNKMLQLGFSPDNITSVGVLSACSRSGLVTEGLNVYNSLVMDYGVSPTVEICACVVDMLGRSGQLDQAFDYINSMPVKPGPSVWGALFCASSLHGNSEMRDLAYRSLVRLEPENPSNYVSLSNVHASSGRWDSVAEIRTRMRERGLRKLPGCSWISIDSKIHSFYVADKTHPCSNLIYRMLDDLVLTMKGAGYVPDFENLT